MKWFRSLPPQQAAVLLLIIANTIWGAASPIFKWALQNIPLFPLAYLRFLGASLLLLPLALRYDLRIARKDWLRLIGLTVCGITVNITFFFLGLQIAPSINAPIIASAGPVFLLLSSMVFLHEKPKRKTCLGTLISLFGVLTIIGRPLLEQGFSFSADKAGYAAMLGNLFFVLATLGAVGHTIISKEILRRYSAVSITFWSFLLGSLTFFPAFVIESLEHNWVATLDVRGITGLVFGIILSSTLAYLIYEWAVGKIAASEIGVFTYIDPVMATLIAIPLLGETITPFFLLGAILVFAGIFISEGRLHYHPFHKLRVR